MVEKTYLKVDEVAELLGYQNHTPTKSSKNSMRSSMPKGF
jgi:hypothetical protein